MQSLVGRPARKTGRRPFYSPQVFVAKNSNIRFRRSQKTKVRLRDLGMNLFSRGSDWAIVAFRSAKEALPSIDFHKTSVFESTDVF